MTTEERKEERKKEKNRTARHSPLLTRGLQVDGCSRVHGDDLRKENPPAPHQQTKQLNTFFEPPWMLHTRVCHAQIHVVTVHVSSFGKWNEREPRTTAALIGLKCLRRRHSVRATSTTTLTTTTGATTTFSYFDVDLPLSDASLSHPPCLSLFLSFILPFSRGVGKRRELAILFTLEVIPLYCVSIGFSPVGRPRSIRYSRLSSLQLPFITFFFLHNFFIANLRSSRRRFVLHLNIQGG